MAFEMVETSQVYIRTLAKIEPEWILLAAGDLLKHHYFEPHWSKKQVWSMPMTKFHYLA